MFHWKIYKNKYQRHQNNLYSYAALEVQTNTTKAKDIKLTLKLTLWASAWSKTDCVPKSPPFRGVLKAKKIFSTKAVARLGASEKIYNNKYLTSARVNSFNLNNIVWSITLDKIILKKYLATLQVSFSRPQKQFSLTWRLHSSIKQGNNRRRIGRIYTIKQWTNRILPARQPQGLIDFCDLLKGCP